MQVAKVSERHFKTIKLIGKDISPGSSTIFAYIPSTKCKILDVRILDNSGTCDISFVQNGPEIIPAFSKKNSRYLSLAVSLTVICRNHGVVNHYAEVEIDFEEIY